VVVGGGERSKVARAVVVAGDSRASKSEIRSLLVGTREELFICCSWYNNSIVIMLL
jgi:hypothetical protein